MDFHTFLGRRNPLKSRSKPTETKASDEEPLKESSSSETTSAQTKSKSKSFSFNATQCSESIYVIRNC